MGEHLGVKGDTGPSCSHAQIQPLATWPSEGQFQWYLRRAVRATNTAKHIFGEKGLRQIWSGIFRYVNVKAVIAVIAVSLQLLKLDTLISVLFSQNPKIYNWYCMHLHTIQAKTSPYTWILHALNTYHTRGVTVAHYSLLPPKSTTISNLSRFFPRCVFHALRNKNKQCWICASWTMKPTVRKCKTLPSWTHLNDRWYNTKHTHKENNWKNHRRILGIARHFLGIYWTTLETALLQKTWQEKHHNKPTLRGNSI